MDNMFTPTLDWGNELLTSLWWIAKAWVVAAVATLVILVLIYRDGSTYNVLDVSLHVQTVITQQRFDTGSNKLQIKTRDIVVEVNGPDAHPL